MHAITIVQTTLQLIHVDISYSVCYLLLFFFFLSFQNEIISLSEKYVRALSRENTDIVDGPYAGRFTAYGIYTTILTTTTLLSNQLLSYLHALS